MAYYHCTSAWPRSHVPADSESVYTDDTDPWDPDLDEAFAEQSSLFVQLVSIESNERCGGDAAAPAAASNEACSATEDAAVAALMNARRSGRKSAASMPTSGKLSQAQAPNSCLSGKHSGVTGPLETVVSATGCSDSTASSDGMNSMISGSSAILSSVASIASGRSSMERVTIAPGGTKMETPLLKRMRTVFQTAAKDLLRSATLLAKHDQDA